MTKLAAVDEAWPAGNDVSIVMPRLNEALSLPHCIANAREALAQIRDPRAGGARGRRPPPPRDAASPRRPLAVSATRRGD